MDETLVRILSSAISSTSPSFVIVNDCWPIIIRFRGASGERFSCDSRNSLLAGFKTLEGISAALWNRSAALTVRPISWKEGRLSGEGRSLRDVWLGFGIDVRRGTKCSRSRIVSMIFPTIPDGLLFGGPK